MIYLDTSILVTAFVGEPTSDAIQNWLSDQEPNTLAISLWSVTEFSSAVALKLRNGQISQNQRAAALSEFRRSMTRILTVFPVSASCFEIAARFVDTHETGLRGGDALHLAIASSNSAILYTRDRRQALAGAALGVTTTLF